MYKGTKQGNCGKESAGLPLYWRGRNERTHQKQGYACRRDLGSDRSLRSCHRLHLSVTVDGDPAELGSISHRLSEDPLGRRLERKAGLQEGAKARGHSVLQAGPSGPSRLTFRIPETVTTVDYRLEAVLALLASADLMTAVK
jgi:hypothetical protein